MYTSIYICIYERNNNTAINRRSTNKYVFFYLHVAWKTIRPRVLCFFMVTIVQAMIIARYVDSKATLGISGGL